MNKIMEQIELKGKKYCLKTFFCDDVSERYLGWLRDPEVNRFLEVRHKPPDREAAVENLKHFDNKNAYFFGIYANGEEQPIGTISMEINLIHQIATFGYLIGEKDYWGEMASLNACCLFFDFAFIELGLRKLSGGVFAKNIGSIFNYKKLGFTREAKLRDHHIIDGNPCDILIFATLKDEWIAQREKFDY